MLLTGKVNFCLLSPGVTIFYLMSCLQLLRESAFSIKTIFIYVLAEITKCQKIHIFLTCWTIDYPVYQKSAKKISCSKLLPGISNSVVIAALICSLIIGLWSQWGQEEGWLSGMVISMIASINTHRSSRFSQPAWKHQRI